MLPEWLVIAGIVAVASVAQTAVGFGTPLIAMPVLVPLLGIRTATPVSTVVGLLLSGLILWRLRQAFNVQAVAPLLLATLGGVPLGVALINWVDTAVLTTILGILVLGYALYALLSPRLPTLEHVGWAYGFGAVAGVLAGALNSAAPAVAMYGSARRWSPDAFRTNLQGYFLVVNTAVLLLHGLAGNLTAVFWQSVGWAIPGMLAGFGAGLWLASRIDPARFTRLVLLLLLVLGLNLIL